MDGSPTQRATTKTQTRSVRSTPRSRPTTASTWFSCRLATARRWHDECVERQPASNTLSGPWTRLATTPYMDVGTRQDDTMSWNPCPDPVLGDRASAEA